MRSSRDPRGTGPKWQDVHDRAEDDGRAYALCIADIDQFKRFNDTYGHPAGDDVLDQVAEILRASVRASDLAARYGGEEFALLLRNTPLEGGFIVAERVRREIESLEVTHDGRRIPCTASVGVAELSASMRRPTDLIEAADQRLYQAKRKGRNRTEAALFD